MEKEDWLVGQRAEMICPRCANTVKAAARFCRSCNYEFGTPVQFAAPVQPAAVPERTKRHRALKAFASITGVLMVFAIAGLMVGGSNNSVPNAPDVPSTPTVVPMQVTALELAQAYSANEVDAQIAFGNKVLNVTGTISGVEFDSFGDPVVKMIGVDQFLPVQASFENGYEGNLRALTRGQRITLQCSSITEIISEPLLSDCVFPVPARQVQAADSGMGRR
jgi:hypothetical protein